MQAVVLMQIAGQKGSGVVRVCSFMYWRDNDMHTGSPVCLKSLLDTSKETAAHFIFGHEKLKENSTMAPVPGSSIQREGQERKEQE